MKRARWIGGRVFRHVRCGQTSLRSRASVAWRLPVVLAGLLVVCVPGCANQRLPAFQRGTSCSARRVQQYANTHNLTYEQALAELRKKDRQMWEEEEARRAKQQRKETPSAADTPPTPDTASEPSSPRRYGY